jgi:hypothetical protein
VPVSTEILTHNKQNERQESPEERLTKAFIREINIYQKSKLSESIKRGIQAKKNKLTK